MAKKTVTVTLEFDLVEEDEFGDKWDDYRFVSMRAQSDIDAEGLASIAERWAQSDRYWVDICSDLLQTVEHAAPVD